MVQRGPTRAAGGGAGKRRSSPIENRIACAVCRFVHEPGRFYHPRSQCPAVPATGATVPSDCVRRQRNPTQAAHARNRPMIRRAVAGRGRIDWRWCDASGLASLLVSAWHVDRSA